jgi:hypothetical protein
MSGAPFTRAEDTDAAFTAAASRFFELLKTFTAQPAAEAQPDWTSLGSLLAAQFEQWLRSSPAPGASFAAAAGFPGTPPGWPPAAVPLGPAAVPGADGQTAWELLMKLGQLQGQLARHWSEIAQGAAQRFIQRQSRAGGAGLTSSGALALYETWVECAEEAYAATVRGADFCELQAQLTNTATALLLTQRQQADRMARAWGLPTREEADAMQRQIRELQRELRERQGGRGAPAAARKRSAAKRQPARRKPPGKPRSRRGRR